MFAADAGGDAGGVFNLRGDGRETRLRRRQSQACKDEVGGYPVIHFLDSLMVGRTAQR